MFRVAAGRGVLLLSIALTFCGATAEAEPDAFSRSYSDSKTNATLEIAVPAGLTFDPVSKVEVLLRTSLSPSVALTLPPDFSDRLEGFKLAGIFTDSVSVVHLSLEPNFGAESYRIKPFPVEVSDSAEFPPSTSSFIAGPVSFVASHIAPVAADKVEFGLEPEYIWPRGRRIAAVVAIVALIVAVLGLTGVCLLRLIRAIRSRLPGPRERAFRELDRLVSSNLIDKNRFKDFYVELPLVVRRYIQRRYGIRATRLTTEEFLALVAKRSDVFSGETQSRLQSFLNTADEVKFAGVAGQASTAYAAIEAARKYLNDEPPDQPDDLSRQKKGGGK